MENNFCNSEFIKIKNTLRAKNFSIPSLALYVHIPFCKSKCLYCDFYSLELSSVKNFLQKENSKALASKFVQKILNDANDLTNLFNTKNFSSIYVGGGTPSLLSCNDIFYLSKTLSKKKLNDGEFTIELNPESLTYDFLEAAIAGGINRFSLGVQTFSENILQSQKRITKTADIENTLALLCNAKQKHKIQISCDLIVGFKNQTKASVIYDIKKLLEVGIKHISIYTLCTADSIQDSENDLANFLFDIAEKELVNAGFTRYEVSNFALGEKNESNHNKAYWNMQNYFGLGPSAVGTFFLNQKQNSLTPTIRTTGFTNIKAWYNTRFPYTVEKISFEDTIKDFLLMQLRLKKGLDKEIFFARFGLEFDKLLYNTIKKFSHFVFENTEKQFALNNKGLNFLTPFLLDAFLEVENFLQNSFKN